MEEVFSSKGRVKIIKLLVDVAELNISGIAERAGLSYSTVREHLRVLKSEGLVKEKRFGRIRILSLNIENPKTKLVKNFVESWNSASELDCMHA